MKKNKIIIPLLLILIGSAIAFYPAIMSFIAGFNQGEVIRKYGEFVSTISEETLDKEYQRAVKCNKQMTTEDYNNILNLQNDGIMGFIEIPSINVNLPIYHGTTDVVLQKGVGHLKESSFPVGGISTHSVIVGHTGLSSAKLFTDLNKVQVDDMFYINILDRVLTYKVYEIDVVLPNEVEKLKVQKDKDLCTLVTCTPYGINTHRLLVQGERCEEYTTNNEILDIKKGKEVKLYIIYMVIILLVVLMFIRTIRKIKNRRGRDI